MRLWSLHPRYLDRQGLTAGWREALLAQAVLAGRTRGYTRHPQLQRFLETSDPVAAVGAFLAGLADEADRRGYRYDRARIDRPGPAAPIEVTTGQLAFEWGHLMRKLEHRSPGQARALATTAEPQVHPIFTVVVGPVASWEVR
jgi:hypothetical protein